MTHQLPWATTAPGDHERPNRKAILGQTPPHSSGRPPNPEPARRPEVPLLWDVNCCQGPVLLTGCRWGVAFCALAALSRLGLGFGFFSFATSVATLEVGRPSGCPYRHGSPLGVGCGLLTPSLGGRGCPVSTSPQCAPEQSPLVVSGVALG